MKAKDIKHVSTWLNQFGINALTGESCAFNRRMLCDVNAEGAELIRDYLGLPYDCQFQKNWNSTVDGKPAIGSVMLDYATLKPLAIYAMLLRGAPYVMVKQDCVCPVSEEYIAGYCEILPNGKYVFQDLGYELIRNKRSGATS